MAQKRRKRRKLRVGRLLLILVILIGLIYLGGVTYYNGQLKPLSSSEEEITISIPSGTSSKEVLQILENEGVIKNASAAYIYARSSENTNFLAGDYTLSPNMTLDEIFTVLSDPQAAIVDTVTVTIVEGDWAKDIANKIASVTNVTSDEFMTLWNDESYIRSLMDRYPFLTEDMFQSDVRILLEGYLAPNTYQFYPETTAEAVTEKLLDQQNVIYEKYRNQIEGIFNIRDVYTLSSIVQYEAGDPANMAAIAQVFYNRMNIGMALQSSVTVCYAMDIDRANDSWMTCEINGNYDNPYNTYMYAGLPPGPILNPGEQAIQAVLNPDTSYEGYYYFMADVTTGQVYYAKTLDEHNANVAKYGVVH